MSRLKRKELEQYRASLLIAQCGICPICETPIDEDPVLDHDHATGHIRAVLHRGCNQAEGRARQALRWIKNDHPNMLINIARYIQVDYSNRPLHPTHKTHEDKRIKVLRRRLKQVSRPSARKRIKDELVQLMAQNS